MTTTFLEYVVTRLLGSPSGCLCLCWVCPWCEHHPPSLVVNAPKPGCRDKFRCHRCRKWGDELDLLWRFEPGSNYGQRMARAADLRQEWEASQESQERPHHPHHQSGRVPSPRGVCDQWATLAWANLMDDLASDGIDPNLAFKTVTRLHEKGWFAECHDRVSRLLAYWAACDAWIAETDGAHVAECDDPQCDAIVCRAERGLPPLTKQEIEAGRLEREEARREAQRRWDEGVERALEALDRRFNRPQTRKGEAGSDRRGKRPPKPKGRVMSD